MLLPLLSLAHDTWLIPSTFTVKAQTQVRLRLATSEAFPASDAPISPARIASVRVRTDAGTTSAAAFRQEGNYLVGDVTVAGSSHTVVLAEFKPNAFVLEPAIFNQYLAEEHADAAIAARAAAGATNSPGRERYRKIAKTVLCPGEPRDDVFAQPSPGVWLEILPDSTPCTLRAGNSLRVRVLLNGKPYTGRRLSAGHEGTRGHHYPVDALTDSGGYATVKFDRAGLWFLRAHHIEAASSGGESDWESVFSTLTVEVKK